MCCLELCLPLLYISAHVGTCCPTIPLFSFLRPQYHVAHCVPCWVYALLSPYHDGITIITIWVDGVCPDCGIGVFTTINDSRSVNDLIPNLLLFIAVSASVRVSFGLGEVQLESMRASRASMTLGRSGFPTLDRSAGSSPLMERRRL